MASHEVPLFLSAALPTELLWHVIHNWSFPSTLIVCSSRIEFLSSTAREIKLQQALPHAEGDQSGQQQQQRQQRRHEQSEQTHTETQTQPPGVIRDTQLVAAPLYQVAVARHIRVVFIPTVSHLRAFLSVFSAEDSKVSAPPATAHDVVPTSPKAPQLLIYGFLDLHRDTSEWSVQGLSNTAAVFVETARRVAFQAVAVEPRTHGGRGAGMDELLAEQMPVLSGSSRKTGLDLQGNGWSGRTVDVRRVLGRWFQFQPGEWEVGGQ